MWWLVNLKGLKFKYEDMSIFALLIFNKNSFFFLLFVLGGGGVGVGGECSNLESNITCVLYFVLAVNFDLFNISLINHWLVSGMATVELKQWYWQVDVYLHSEEEKQLKKIIWEEMNKEYLEVLKLFSVSFRT